MTGTTGAGDAPKAAMAAQTRRWVIFAFAGFAVTFMAVVIGLWSMPIGSGEHRHSPDQRFKAEACNMHRGTLLGDRDRYIEISVTEVDTGRNVWHVVYRTPIGLQVPHYGARGVRFVTWAADSSAVTIPVAGEKQITFPVR